MKIPLLVAALAVATHAVPVQEIVTYRSVLPRDGSTKPGTSQESIDKCNEAFNCEVYEDPVWGTNIRFAPGHEPQPGKSLGLNVTGELTSNSSDVSKRQDQYHLHSNVQLGPRRINWGGVNPYDVTTKLWDLCQYTGCDPKPATYGVQLVINGNHRELRNLILHAEGMYDGWDARDGFVKAMLELSQKQQSWNLRKWYHNRAIPDWGQQWECDMFDVFEIQVWWGHPRAFGGKMRLWVENGGSWGSPCEFWQGAAKDAISAISGWGGWLFGMMEVAQSC